MIPWWWLLLAPVIIALVAVFVVPIGLRYSYQRSIARDEQRERDKYSAKG
jgi:heme exporter protein D